MEEDYTAKLFDMTETLARATISIRRANASLTQYASNAVDYKMVKRIDPEWIAQKATDIEKLCGELLTVTRDSMETFTAKVVQEQAQAQGMVTPVKAVPATRVCPGAPNRACACRRRLVLSEDEEEEEEEEVVVEKEEIEPKKRPLKRLRRLLELVDD